MNDRAAEGWEPLLAIADMAGGDWPCRARAAALALHAGAVAEESVGVLLLSAIRDIFHEKGTDKLPTAGILAALVERDDGPWGDWWGKQVRDGDTRGPGRKLSTLLRPYGVVSHNVALDDGSRPKGYALAGFADAFTRYLPAPKLGLARVGESRSICGYSEKERLCWHNS
ncbi:MAG: DUF3631 domain-containing protein [Chloroflexota bacterium]|nr:DUF3631 domain-containing protein [Chloroflexota bacterium]